MFFETFLVISLHCIWWHQDDSIQSSTFHDTWRSLVPFDDIWVFFKTNHMPAKTSFGMKTTKLLRRVFPRHGLDSLIGSLLLYNPRPLWKVHFKAKKTGKSSAFKWYSLMSHRRENHAQLMDGERCHTHWMSPVWRDPMFGHSYLVLRVMVTHAWNGSKVFVCPGFLRMINRKSTWLAQK